MTDNDNILGSSRRFRLSADVMALMVKGAGYAAIFCTAILVIALLLLAVSNALPEASKQAADPSPDLSMITAAEDLSQA